jgi:phosphoglycolate phosphatase-like HAD superfamily hydrolase
MRKKTFNKEVILDLDYTLFDTARFKRALARSLKPYGVNHDLFFNFYPQAVQKQDGKYKYSVNKHLSLLRQRVADIPRVQALSRIKKVVEQSYLYLYPTSVRFLQHLKKNGFRLILVTHGDKSFQMKKIKHSGIQKYFTKTIVSDRLKAITLKPLVKNYDEVFFISDHAGELKQVKTELPQLLPVMKLVDYSSRSQVRGFGIPAFRSLKKIENYIINYYNRNKNRGG